MPRPEDSVWAVPVAQVASRAGQSKAIDAVFPAPSGIGDNIVGIAEGTDVHVVGSFDSIVDGLVLTARIIAPVSTECTRCLKPINKDWTVDVTAFFPYDSGKDAKDAAHGHQNGRKDEEVDIIAGEEEYCPSCGVRLPEGVFRERGLTDLAQFCEKAIAAMGVDPVLARIGQESWRFHKGSSEIRLFVYEDSYLFCTSPINILPKRDLEPVLTYLLSADVAPYKLGLEENQIYIAYRVHLTDIFSDEAPRIGRELTGLALKADELDDYLHENYGCDFSEYARREEQN